MQENMKNKPAGRLSLHVSPRRRYLYMLGGHVSVALGLIGLLLPLIPTSPFMIAAAYCYARSSERFYYLLLNNKYFGKEIRLWEERRCVARHVKIFFIAALILMFSGTIVFFVEPVQAQIIAALTACAIIAAVSLLPVCKAGGDT